ncbi:MAG: hypothetical protein ACRC46_11940 [Thermoguttaceae bacterium]
MTATALPNRASQSRSVPVVSTDEVTIDRAAEILDLTQSFVASLVKCRCIPFRYDGVNFVVRPADIEACRVAETELRLKVVAEMVAEDQKMGLYE